MNAPQKHFWRSGQSFLIVAQKHRWAEITQLALHALITSPFDLLEVGVSGSLNVDEARLIRSANATTPSQGSTKLLVIQHADQATDEAANTLLKVLEEPALTTRFLLLSQTRNVLPTISSRCALWTEYIALATTSETAVPLDPETDFATVSMELARMVAAGHHLTIVDQWTKQLLRSTTPQAENLHWLFRIRRLLETSSTNPRALLEATYLHLVNRQPIPEHHQLRMLERDHGHL